jgi:hypothetical protein
MGSYVRTQTVEHDVGERGEVLLRLTSGDVQIRAVEGSTARLQAVFDLAAGSEQEADEQFERLSLRVEASRGRLEISEPRRNGHVSLAGLGRLVGLGGRRNLEVTLEMPAHASLAFQSVSADLVATGLRGDQRYRTVSGDLVLNELAGRVELNAVSGDTTLRADGALDLDARSVSGNILAVAPRFESLRAATVSGDIEAEGALDAGPSHRTETVSGDLAIAPLNGVTLEVRGLSTEVHSSIPHRREGSRDRRRYVIGDGAATIRFNSMSGDVRVERPRRLHDAEPPQPPAPPAPAPHRRPMSDEERIELLRAVERGEIDVDEAARRLSGEQTDA